MTEALGSQNTGRELFAFFMARVSSSLSYFYFQGLFSSSHFGDVLNTDETQCTQSYWTDTHSFCGFGKKTPNLDQVSLAYSENYVRHLASNSPLTG